MENTGNATARNTELSTSTTTDSGLLMTSGSASVVVYGMREKLHRSRFTEQQQAFVKGGRWRPFDFTRCSANGWDETIVEQLTHRQSVSHQGS
jgi:hypothetical protein